MKSLARLSQVARLPGVGICLVLALVLVTAFSQMEGTFTTFLISRFLSLGPVPVRGGVFSVVPVVSDALTHEASLKSGYLFLAVGLLAVLVQGGLLGRLKARFGEGRLVGVGAAAATLGLFLLPTAPSYRMLFLPMGLLSVGSALYMPSLSALVSLRSPGGRQGEALGTFQAMGSLGRILGPALGGLLFAVVSPSAPFLVAGGLGVLAMFLAPRILSSRLRHPSGAAPD